MTTTARSAGFGDWPDPEGREAQPQGGALTQRTSRAAYAELTPDSSFRQLVELWLEDLDLAGKLAPSTRAVYERNMRQLVMPVFEHYAVREITLAPGG